MPLFENSFLVAEVAAAKRLDASVSIGRLVAKVSAEEFQAFPFLRNFEKPFWTEGDQTRPKFPPFCLHVCFRLLRDSTSHEGG